MAKAKFNKDAVAVSSGKDGIIIRKHIAGLEGGRVLDTAAAKDNSNNVLIPAYTLEVVPCGIPVVSKSTNGVKNYLALPPKDVTVTTGEGQSATTTTTYKFDLPDGYSYEGIASATVKAGMPCPVMTAGVVNETVMLEHLKELFPSEMETPTALSLSALKSACPHLIFMSDEANDVPSNS